MKIQLSDHFTCKRLLKFVLPSVVMMIFTSIYGVIDGLFVSNFVGKTPFAAVNFIMPVLMMMSALGFMIGSGGSAITAKTLGEGDNAKANGVFSLMVYTAIILGIILTAAGQLALRLFFLYCIAEIARIGDRHVAAAAPALDIIDARLAEQRNTRSPVQRQQAVFILQKHHSIGSGAARERDVLRTSGHAPSVLPQRQHGKIVESPPFTHSRLLPERKNL